MLLPICIGGGIVIYIYWWFCLYARDVADVEDGARQESKKDISGCFGGWLSLEEEDK